MFLVLFLIWPAWGYQLGWTGFGASRSPVKNPKAPFDYYPSKSLWDWMQLLIIPVVLVIAGFLLNSAQQRRERDIAKENRAQDLEIAEDRQQEAALDTYLATMTNVLLDKGLGEPVDAMEEDEDKQTLTVRVVVQVQTLTVLRRLNAERKGIVVRFLYGARLIEAYEPIVNLTRADLDGADLSGAFLRAASLQGVSLRGARLCTADLSQSNLSGATLRAADMRQADLREANLSGADLREANLSGVVLGGIGLNGPDLRGSVLTGVTGLSAEKLERQTSSLQDAIMPDGSMHP